MFSKIYPRVTSFSGSLLLNLIVCFLLDPSTRVATEQVLSGLVVAEDEDGEGDCGQPPVDLQRVHPQTLIHSGRVREDGSKNCFEDEAKVHEVILHALLEHRVLPCLADDQIGPLDNNDGDEEGGVAGVLQDLPVGVGPLLAVGVGQIVHCNGVPGPAEPKQMAWPEAILTKDDKID